MWVAAVSVRGQTKVKRYLAGKAPEWADAADIRTMNMNMIDEDPALGIVIVRKDDPRLRHLSLAPAVSRIDNNLDRSRHQEAETVEDDPRIDDNHDRVRADHQEKAEIVDEEAVEDERRRKIREKLLHREQEEAAALLPEEEEEEESESEYEYKTDCEEERTGPTFDKMVFAPKSDRYTIAERERERLESEDRAFRKQEERKLETKLLVVEEIRKDEEIQQNMDMDEEANNNIADIDEWKVREIARTKRARDRDRVREDDRLKDKTREWDMKRKRKNPMHKYYHEGAFFQSEPDR